MLSNDPDECIRFHPNVVQHHDLYEIHGTKIMTIYKQWKILDRNPIKEMEFRRKKQKHAQNTHAVCGGCHTLIAAVVRIRNPVLGFYLHDHAEVASRVE